MDEQHRLEILKQIDRSKGLTNRNRQGQFATPAALAREIVEVALSWLGEAPSIHYLEPGFGTSPFFAALTRLLEHQLTTAVGYEIDVEYADAAERLYAGTCLQLRRQDFLLADPPSAETDKFNLVVSNPPYVRHHHLSKDQKIRFRELIKGRTSLVLSGLSGLYAYFLLASLAWMRPNGIGAWLIPSEFMDVNYGRKVKEFLCHQTQLLRIHRFPPTSLQFDDALVTSAIAFFRNGPPSSSVEFSQGHSLRAPEWNRSIEVNELVETTKWSTAFVRSKPRANRRVSPLSDYFRIQRGLATGSNSFFVMSNEEANERSLPREFLRPLLPSPRKLESDNVRADGDGLPQVRELRWLLTCHLPEDEVRQRYPSLWTYLETGVQRGVDQTYLCRHRAPWYRQEQRPPAPFLCTYMARGRGNEQAAFRFVLNRSQATATNVYLMLYPKPSLTAFLDCDDRYEQVWEALRAITSASLHREGRVYGGGLHKLEPKELANADAGALAEWIRRP